MPWKSQNLRCVTFSCVHSTYLHSLKICAWNIWIYSRKLDLLHDFHIVVRRWLAFMASKIVLMATFAINFPVWSTVQGQGIQSFAAADACWTGFVKSLTLGPNLKIHKVCMYVCSCTVYTVYTIYYISARPYPSFCRTVRRRTVRHFFWPYPYAYGRTPYLFYLTHFLRIEVEWKDKKCFYLIQHCLYHACTLVWVVVRLTST